MFEYIVVFVTLGIIIFLRLRKVFKSQNLQSGLSHAGSVVGLLQRGQPKGNLTTKELQLIKEARTTFLDTKNDFFKRFSEATLSDELVSLRETMIPTFDSLVQLFLCTIASADGPINAREAEVISLLLGTKREKNEYNLILENSKNIDVLNLYGPVIDLSLQFNAVEHGRFDGPGSDPIVKCFEILGQAVLAADGDVSERELKCLSEYTAIAHSKAAELDRRIQSLASGDVPAQSGVTPAGEPTRGSAKESAATLDQCIADLHALVGLASVKREIETLTNLARVFTMRKGKGLPVPDVSFHMVFSGNPGTGKTTVARIVAKIYGCLGLLTAGQLIEVDRSGLVGNFVGQTATKTRKVIDQAKGGILFIDEAYALAKDSENDFGAEAIEVLLKSMEDYRDDLVVIAAGYTDKMAKFLGSNPGLRSRFPRSIIFPDYSAGELEEIFLRQAKRSQYRLADEAGTILKDEMQRLWQRRGPDFANARDVRNLFERVVAMQANRISGSTPITTNVLTTITEVDVRSACS